MRGGLARRAGVGGVREGAGERGHRHRVVVRAAAAQLHHLIDVARRLALAQLGQQRLGRLEQQPRRSLHLAPPQRATSCRLLLLRRRRGCAS